MLFAGLLALALTASANANTLNKCIDAQGQVTYSNLPCRNAKEARTVEIDPPPPPDPARAKNVLSPAVQATPSPVSKRATNVQEPATIRLETQRTTGKQAPRVSARQCDALTDKIGRVFDKMDQARRKGYTQDQMNKWNQEVKDLERKKQQAGCF